MFTVVEGPRATVQVELLGLPPEVPLDKARKLVGLADGAPFDYAPYDDAKTALHHAIENAGYATADEYKRYAGMAAGFAGKSFNVDHSDGDDEGTTGNGAL